MRTHLCALIAILAVCAACSPKESLSPLATGYAVYPNTVAVEIQNYQPQAGDTFQNLFVSNYSVMVSQGSLYYSTARDLNDQLKTSLTSTYGFTTASPESAVAGFADLMLYQLGLNLGSQSTLICSASLMQNSSADALTYNDDRVPGSPLTFLGLRDCDKIYMGLNPSLFSFNGDGIPDYLQMRCGMNPLDKDEAFVSTSGDGVANIDKCKRHIPIDEDVNTQANEAYAYQYNTQVNNDGSSTFTVSNIPVLNNGEENFIAFYITETNTGTNTSSIYSAYAILNGNYVGKTLIFNYWGTSSATFTNQQVVVP